MAFSLFGAKKEQVKNLVLVVDEDDQVVSLIKHALEAMGCTVISSDNGHDALSRADTRHPTLILLDLKLEGFTGKQVLDVLKENPRTKDIPVIMVTAEQKGSDVEDAFAAGAAGYLIKPIQVNRLKDKVMKYIQPSQTQGA